LLSRSTLLAALLALFGLSAVAADEVTEYRTEHFVIYAVEEVPDEAVEMAASQAERFYASLAEFLGESPTYRITILLQGNAERPDGSWGYPHVDSYGRIHLYQFSPQIESYFNSLAHEMVHVFRFHRRTNRDWFFEEGFAEFVALRVDPSLEGFPWYGFPLTVVAGQWLASDRDIPLSALRSEHEKLNLPCKAQSYSLRSSFFDYLGRNYGDEKVVEMAGWEGAGADVQFRTIFGKRFEELTAEWRAALLKDYTAIENVEALTQAYLKSPVQYMEVCEQSVDY